MKYFVAPISIYHYLTYSCANRLKQPNDIIPDINFLLRKASISNLKLHLVLIDVMEGRVYDNDIPIMLAELEQVVKSFNVEYTFILDGDNQEYSKITGIDNIVYSDFLAISSYVNGVLPEDQLLNESWNNTSTKGLWTMGRAERPHRVLLLSKLWENNLLHKLDWSFYTYDSNRDYIRKNFLNHYDDETFQRFINESTRSLDFKVDIKSCDDFHCTGYPFDSTLYKNTSFSIIAESDFNIYEDQTQWTPKITEKTYRTIINKHPFICAWYPGMIKKLKSKGYRTFENYATNPGYNNIIDLNDRLDATLKVIEDFHKSINQPEVVNKVRNDIEFNYQTYLNNVEIELAKLTHLFELPQLDAVQMTPTKLGRFMFPRTTNLFGQPADVP